MKKPNIDIIDDLKKCSLDALRDGYYIESSIIIFQAVEQLLRILISGIAKAKNVKEDITNRCYIEEQSFSRLITYYELLDPNNELTDRLKKLNQNRNSMIHRIFYDFESLTCLKDELREFIKEAVKLNELIRSELNSN